MLIGNDALAVDIAATKIMQLNWKETYLSYIADKIGMGEGDIRVEGLPITAVEHRFEPPRIDLPVKAQMMIYQHEYLTKMFFCSLDIVKLFQKITMAYRQEPVQTA
jgi:hypothetical protein